MNKNIQYLIESMKQRFKYDDDFYDLTDTDIIQILDETAINDFLDKHIVIDAKILRLKDNWIGQYIQGESLKKSFQIIPNAIDLDELMKLIASLSSELIDTSNEEAKKAFGTKITKMKHRFMDIFGESGVETVSHCREASSLAIESDPIGNKMFFELRNTEGFFKIPMVEHDESQYYCEDTQLHLDQFSEHFPDIRAVTEWICASRFGPTGWQDSYLHIQAPSGFGKSNLFIDIWKGLGYGHETTLDNLKASVTGKTTGESARSYVQASVIFIDEEVRFARELKNIANRIKITEKYKGTIEVPIYAKIFLSKEDPSYLMNDIGDSQIIGRFSKISYIDKAARYVDFIKRTGYSDANHIQAIKWLVISTMNRWRNLYRENTKTCELEARKVLNEFTEKFGLQNTMQSSSDAPDIIGEHFLEFMILEVDVPKGGRTPIRIVESGKYEGQLYCAKSDYNVYWQRFVDSQHQDVKFTYANSNKITQNYVLAGGKEVKSTIDGKNGRWCVFNKSKHEPQLVSDSSHTIDDYEVEDIRLKGLK